MDKKTEVLCILTAMAGYLFAQFDEFHEWISHQLDRDVYTHEFARKETFEEAIKSLSKEQIADAVDFIRGTLELPSFKELHEENEKRRMENLPEKVVLTGRPYPATECPRCKKGRIIGVRDEDSTVTCRVCGRFKFEVLTQEQFQERIVSSLGEIFKGKSIITVIQGDEPNDSRTD